MGFMSDNLTPKRPATAVVPVTNSFKVALS